MKTPLTRSTCKKGWPLRPAGKLHKPRKCGVTLIGKINSQVDILGIIFFKSDFEMTKKKFFFYLDGSGDLAPVGLQDKAQVVQGDLKLKSIDQKYCWKYFFVERKNAKPEPKLLEFPSFS